MLRLGRGVWRPERLRSALDACLDRHWRLLEECELERATVGLQALRDSP
ncbi:hypothetical protein [Mumia zhuanghuii]|nr:hypothetical protein [Mumia zhuanghuii]